MPFFVNSSLRIFIAWVLLLRVSAGSFFNPPGNKIHTRSILRAPRLELVHPTTGEGAVLYVYNEDLINATSPLEDSFNCTVSGGHLEMIGKEWQLVRHVDLYREAKTEVWRVLPVLYNSFPGVLQTRSRIEVAYEVEGELKCKDLLGMGLVSNPILLRFSRTETFIVRLAAPPSWSGLPDALQDYKKRGMVGRAVTVSECDIFVRVSCTESSEVDDAVMLERVKNATEDIVEGKKVAFIWVRSTRFCHPEEEGDFSWPKTPVGRSAVPENPCLDVNGASTPTRRCLGDFFRGVYWEEAPKSPGRCSEITDRTQRLRNISSSMGEEDSFGKLAREVANGSSLVAFEISLVSDALESIIDEIKKPSSGVEAPSLSSLASVVNAVLDSGKNNIKAANTISGSSDTILVAVDELIAASATAEPSGATTPHFSALAVPTGTGIRGVSVFADQSSPGKLTPILQNQSLQNVLDLSPRVAVLLLQSPDDAGFSSTLFEDDALFGSTNERTRLQAPVIGLSLFRKRDGEEVNAAETPVTVLLIFPLGDRKGDCSFWDIRGGRWSSEGCVSFPSSELPGSPDVEACVCTHLTHFTMLITDFYAEVTEGDSENLSIDPSEKTRQKVGGENRNGTSEVEGGTEEEEHERLLSLITVIGCSVSVFCLALTFLYAALSPQWRRSVYRKIELNLFASVALLDGAELVVGTFEVAPEHEFRAACVIMGALLHYSVLATFTWMMVVAALQSLRLSPGTILDARRRAGTHLLLKASVFAWGLPAIPVVTTLCIGTDLYVRRPQTAFCYPRGFAFQAGVLFPVAMAVIINTFVFVWLLRTLFCISKVRIRVHCGAERSRSIRRFFYSLFLFCLLGLNWIVGLLLEPSKSCEKTHRILSYVFCCTATLHGSSLFIFFVACEPRLGDKLSEDMSYLRRRSHGVSVRFTNVRASLNGALDRKSGILPTPIKKDIYSAKQTEV